MFLVKRNKDNSIERFKARLVVRGCEQHSVPDYEETYSPVVRSETVTKLIAVSAARGWHVTQFDVATAFLHGSVTERIYIRPPHGVRTRPNECLLLKKAPYGLKQAPRAWKSTFTMALTKLGFHQSESDLCVFFNHNESTYVTVYVDDGLIFCPNISEGHKLVTKLND